MTALSEAILKAETALAKASALKDLPHSITLNDIRVVCVAAVQALRSLLAAAKAPAPALPETASEAERLLRLTCERLVGTPVAEQSSSLADISLAIDAALHRIAAAPAPALPDDTDDEPVNCGPLDDVRTFTLVPAPALPEASVLGWATLAVALLQRHSTAWEHDPGQGDDDCDEDCRACEYEALLRTGRAALAGNHPEIPDALLSALDAARSPR